MNRPARNVLNRLNRSAAWLVLVAFKASAEGMALPIDRPAGLARSMDRKRFSILGEEVNTMSAILEIVEQTLVGTKPEVIDVPGDKIPDYLPRMSNDNNC